MPTDAPYRIRQAAPADLSAVAEIERRVFSDPWPESGFRALLGPLGLVAVTPAGEVAGYVFARQALDEAEILNVAVRPERRRAGIGRSLVEAILAALSAGGARRVYLEVRESNLAAQAFYGRLGFGQVGRRRGYYARPREDALILASEIGPS